MIKAGYHGGDALVDALIAHGANMAFGVPGESYLAALDAMVDREDEFRFITCRHEAGAANMAEAYGKMTGEPGICFVTRGPGATHASIGLHTAYQDSTPMIMLIGQVASDQVDREAFQEIDYRRMFGEVTKWVGQIDRADRIAEYVGQAWRRATSGRPGPVVLSLPEDMLSGPAPEQASRAHKAVVAHPGRADMETLQTMLSVSDKPMIMAGGSGWTPEAVADLERFAEFHHIPICASFRCQDRMNNDHPCYAGDMGIAANPKLVARMAESDCLIVLGPRLGEMTTAGYERIKPGVPDQQIIHVHQGAEELGRVYQCDLMINAAPGPFMRALMRLEFPEQPGSRDWCEAARADYEAWQVPTDNAGAVQVAELYEHMKSVLPADAIYTNGAGNYATWLHRFNRYRSFPSQLAPTSGAMGYGVPAAIGAAIMAPEREVFCFGGDGCFTMSANELPTAVQYGAKVVFLVFNNGMYGTIRMHQEKTYPKRVSGTALVNPDFVKLAEAMGMPGWRVERTEDFADALASARAADGPALIEIVIDPEAITPVASLSEL